YDEALAGWRALDESFAGDKRGVLTGHIFPDARKCAVRAAEADAALRLAQLALAATAYRAKHGAYPGKLDDLVPQDLDALPRDPFDGRPLRLKHDGKGLVLYSIGRDLRDDGGVAVGANREPGDIVFRLR